MRVTSKRNSSFPAAKKPKKELPPEVLIDIIALVISLSQVAVLVALLLALPA